MADNLDINTHLRTLGLDLQEARIYTNLLQDGTTAVMALSKNFNLPRTTVYRLCQKLAERHFLEWVVTRQGKKVKAIEPDRLTQIIKQHEDRLKQAQSSLQALQAFRHSLKSSLPRTQVRYYHGKEGMKQVIWNTLQARAGIIGYSGFFRSDIVGVQFENDYAAERRPNKITDTVIISQISDGLERTLHDFPHQIEFTRFFVLEKPDFQITGDTYIYNDVYAVNFWNQNEVIGIEIQNQELVNLQTAIFNQLLLLATPLKP